MAMNENEKIKKILEDHKALFEATNMDVAESMKGQWYFTRYQAEYDYYDCIIRFKTAKELAEIILGELAVDLFITIDSEPEKVQTFDNFADEIEMEACYKPHIDRLIKYLEK